MYGTSKIIILCYCIGVMTYIFLLDLSRTHAQHPIFRIGWFLLNNWAVITELLCIRLQATKLGAAGNDGISKPGGGASAKSVFNP